MNFRGKEEKKPHVDFPPDSKAISPQPKSFNWRLIAILMVYMLMVVHFFERIVPKHSVKLCDWSKWEQWHGKLPRPHRIALIGDPQIVDDHTYPKYPRILLKLVQALSDNYLHRNQAYLHSYLDPDTIIYLGDLFDGGREWDDEVWFEEYKRFNKVLPKKVNRLTIESLAGNHDIGFQEIDLHKLRRFTSFFGNPNDFFELGNHTVILLDTISLSHPDPAINHEAKEFLLTINDHINQQFPRILLTHVPLYRSPDNQLCGPLRESKRLFPLQRGKQYQTVIEYELSQTILHTIKPSIVFSGDDHDYCDIFHPFFDDGKERLAREVTVKTASMTNGIKFPGYQLVSLNNPYDPKPKTKKPLDSDEDDDDDETFKTEMCYLPSPYLALKCYVLALLLALSVIAGVFLFPQQTKKITSGWPMALKQKLELPLYDAVKWRPTGNRVERSYRLFLLHSGVLLVLVYVTFAAYFTLI